MFQSQRRLAWAFVASLGLVMGFAEFSRAADVASVGSNKNAVEKTAPPQHASPQTNAAPQHAAKEAKPSEAAAKKRSHHSRVVFIVDAHAARSDAELARLRRPGGDFEKMRAAGWRIGKAADNQIQIVDRQQVPELVKKLNPKEFPVVACVEDGEVVRSFKSGCTTPLDAWTFGFLAKGIDERPPGQVPEVARVESTGSYPLRGNHWSVEGDWNPTREKVIDHLRGPNHARQLEPQWHIDSWSYEELRSLHDDLHERYDAPTFSGGSSTKTGPTKSRGF